jgi:hypothetical protein
MVLSRSQLNVSTIRSNVLKMSLSSVMIAAASSEMAMSVNPTKSSITIEAASNRCGVVAP